LKFRKWLLKLIDARNGALAEDAAESRKMGMGETEGRLYRNQSFANAQLAAIWRLDESSRRLEILTVVLAFLTALLFVRTLLP
jgi:hypothetical protein